MIRLAIVVEGQTEEEFVKTMIVSHLQSYDVYSQPIQLLGAVSAPRDATMQLHDVRMQFRSPKSPEDINDNKNTAPSKRIQRIVPQYNKIADGTRVAKNIGLEKIRAACPRFGAWVAKMERLARRG